MYIPAPIAALTFIAAVLLCYAISAAVRIRSKQDGCTMASKEYAKVIQQKNQQIDELNTTIEHDCNIAHRARADAANAMEQLAEVHNEELAQLRKAHSVWAEQQLHLNAVADRLATTAMEKTLTDTELQLLDDMSQKLRLGSSALHATQQFADSKQAGILANRAQTLLKRLRTSPETKKDAA